MARTNTTLDDIASVIGFSNTLRLSAWFGDLNYLYVPGEVCEGQVIVKLIGFSAAKKLSEQWGNEHIWIPRLRSYEEEERRRTIGRMLERGFGTREVASVVRIGERRVQQICRELEVEGLIEPIAPRKNAGEKAGGD